MSREKNIFFNKKGLGPTTIIAILAALIMGAVVVISSTDIFTKGGEQIADNIAKSCQRSLDGEGPFLAQQLRGDCPCDLDKDNGDGLYLGKYYVVKEKARVHAEKIFDAKFLTDNNPLKIHQVDLDTIQDFIKDMEDKSQDKKHDFSYKLSPYFLEKLTEMSEDARNKVVLEAYCPEYNSNNPASCQFGIFMEAWFENGPSAQGTCITSSEDCKARLVNACDDSQDKGTLV